VTALATTRELMTRLGLTVNETKTRLARLPEDNLALFALIVENL
jgi:hypothetical protein